MSHVEGCRLRWDNGKKTSLTTNLFCVDMKRILLHVNTKGMFTKCFFCYEPRVWNEQIKSKIYLKRTLEVREARIE